MERDPRFEPATDETEAFWKGYDAVPRDGPAAFIVRTAALDQGTLHGQWLDATAPAIGIARQIEGLTGQPGELGGYSIIDQAGFGAEMLEEDLTPGELARAALARVAGGRP